MSSSSRGRTLVSSELRDSSKRQIQIKSVPSKESLSDALSIVRSKKLSSDTPKIDFRNTVSYSVIEQQQSAEQPTVIEIPSTLPDNISSNFVKNSCTIRQTASPHYATPTSASIACRYRRSTSGTDLHQSIPLTYASTSIVKKKTRHRSTSPNSTNRSKNTGNIKRSLSTSKWQHHCQNEASNGDTCRKDICSITSNVVPNNESASEPKGNPTATNGESPFPPIVHSDVDALDQKGESEFSNLSVHSGSTLDFAQRFGRRPAQTGNANEQKDDKVQTNISSKPTDAVLSSANIHVRKPIKDIVKSRKEARSSTSSDASCNRSTSTHPSRQTVMDVLSIVRARKAEKQVSEDKPLVRSPLSRRQDRVCSEKSVELFTPDLKDNCRDNSKVESNQQILVRDETTKGITTVEKMSTNKEPKKNDIDDLQTMLDTYLQSPVQMRTLLVSHVRRLMKKYDLDADSIPCESQNEVLFSENQRMADDRTLSNVEEFISRLVKSDKDLARELARDVKTAMSTSKVDSVSHADASLQVKSTKESFSDIDLHYYDRSNYVPMLERDEVAFPDECNMPSWEAAASDDEIVFTKEEPQTQKTISKYLDNLTTNVFSSEVNGLDCAHVLDNDSKKSTSKTQSMLDIQQIGSDEIITAEPPPTVLTAISKYIDFVVTGNGGADQHPQVQTATSLHHGNSVYPISLNGQDKGSHKTYIDPQVLASIGTYIDTSVTRNIGRSNLATTSISVDLGARAQMNHEFEDDNYDPFLSDLKTSSSESINFQEDNLHPKTLAAIGTYIDKVVGYEPILDENEYQKQVELHWKRKKMLESLSSESQKKASSHDLSSKREIDSAIDQFHSMSSIQIDGKSSQNLVLETLRKTSTEKSSLIDKMKSFVTVSDKKEVSIDKVGFIDSSISQCPHEIEPSANVIALLDSRRFMISKEKNDAEISVVTSSESTSLCESKQTKDEVLDTIQDYLDIVRTNKSNQSEKSWVGLVSKSSKGSAKQKSGPCEVNSKDLGRWIDNITLKVATSGGFDAESILSDLLTDASELECNADNRVESLGQAKETGNSFTYITAQIDRTAPDLQTRTRQLKDPPIGSDSQSYESSGSSSSADNTKIRSVRSNPDGKIPQEMVHDVTKNNLEQTSYTRYVNHPGQFFDTHNVGGFLLNQPLSPIMDATDEDSGTYRLSTIQDVTDEDDSTTIQSSLQEKFVIILDDVGSTEIDNVGGSRGVTNTLHEEKIEIKHTDTLVDNKSVTHVSCSLDEHDTQVEHWNNSLQDYKHKSALLHQTCPEQKEETTVQVNQLLSNDTSNVILSTKSVDAEVVVGTHIPNQVSTGTVAAKNHHKLSSSAGVKELVQDVQPLVRNSHDVQALPDDTTSDVKSLSYVANTTLAPRSPSAKQSTSNSASATNTTLTKSSVMPPSSNNLHVTKVTKVYKNQPSCSSTTSAKSEGDVVLQNPKTTTHPEQPDPRTVVSTSTLPTATTAAAVTATTTTTTLMSRSISFNDDDLVVLDDTIQSNLVRSCSSNDADSENTNIVIGIRNRRQLFEHTISEEKKNEDEDDNDDDEDDLWSEQTTVEEVIRRLFPLLAGCIHTSETSLTNFTKFVRNTFPFVKSNEPGAYVVSQLLRDAQQLKLPLDCVDRFLELSLVQIHNEELQKVFDSPFVEEEQKLICFLSGLVVIAEEKFGTTGVDHITVSSYLATDHQVPTRTRSITVSSSTIVEEAIEIDLHNGFVDKTYAPVDQHQKEEADEEPWWDVVARLNSLSCTASSYDQRNNNNNAMSSFSQQENNIASIGDDDDIDRIQLFWNDDDHDHNKRNDETKPSKELLENKTTKRGSRRHTSTSHHSVKASEESNKQIQPNSKYGKATTTTITTTTTTPAMIPKQQLSWKTQFSCASAGAGSTSSTTNKTAPYHSISAVQAASSLLEEGSYFRRKHTINNNNHNNNHSNADTTTTIATTTKLPQIWKQSYLERTQNHQGYYDIDIYSLCDSAQVVNSKILNRHVLDDQPWEHRIVKQRFLHEHSISFTRNWFGYLSYNTANNHYATNKSSSSTSYCPCPIQSMPMPMRAADEWKKEWYQSKWTLKKSSYPSLALQCSHTGLSSKEEDDEREQEEEERERTITKTVGSWDHHHDRYDCDTETYDDDDDGDDCCYSGGGENVPPECGTLQNIILQPSSYRLCRLTPEWTSCLRKSQWRKQYLPHGINFQLKKKKQRNKQAKKTKQNKTGKLTN